jgi:hypothetical protein
VPTVADRRADDADLTTKGDTKRREVSVLSAPGNPVERALSQALYRAAEAGRFDVVAQLARELEARRLARMANVVVLPAKMRRRSE